MHPTLPALLVALAQAHAGGIPVVHGVVQVLPPTRVQIGQAPVLALAVPDRPAVLFVECTVQLPDGRPRTFSQTSPVLAPGDPVELALDVAPPTSQATCLVVASFANGLSERRPVELSWTWEEATPPQEEEVPPEGPAPETPAPAAPAPAAPAPAAPSSAAPPVQPR